MRRLLAQAAVQILIYSSVPRSVQTKCVWRDNDVCAFSSQRHMHTMSIARASDMHAAMSHTVTLASDSAHQHCSSSIPHLHVSLSAGFHQELYSLRALITVKASLAPLSAPLLFPRFLFPSSRSLNCSLTFFRKQVGFSIARINITEHECILSLRIMRIPFNFIQNSMSLHDFFLLKPLTPVGRQCWTCLDIGRSLKSILYMFVQRRFWNFCTR